MNAKQKIAVRLLILSILVLIICRIISELDIKYNILNFDKHDIVGNILYYGIIIFIYIVVIIAVYLLYTLVKEKLLKQKK